MNRCPQAERAQTMTAGQRWRFRRNLVILLASRAGISQRFLADVFDLPRSRIGTIIKELESGRCRERPDGVPYKSAPARLSRRMLAGQATPERAKSPKREVPGAEETSRRSFD